ncbi:MAG: hypothetical protein SGI72_13760 [Planctomycetota bacterium]|nr:hypothetical protein [Planctomycetota bacterium]
MIQLSDISTLTDFKRSFAEMIEKLESPGWPKVLTVEDAPNVVVSGVAAFERMAAMAARVEVTAGIEAGLDDVNAGRTNPMEQVFKELPERLGLPPKP